MNIDEVVNQARQRIESGEFCREDEALVALAARPGSMRWTKIAPGSALPEPCVPVLVFVEGIHGGKKSRRLRAQYAAPKTLELDHDCEGGEYDEATDTWYCDEGWYEDNEGDEVHWRIDGNVTHWMPLPPPPDVTAE